MVAALTLAVSLAAGARADEPQEVGHPAPPLSLQSSLNVAQSWQVVEEGFPTVLQTYARQIEAAPANHYFPRTLVWVRPGVDAAGHFLDARCGSLLRNKRCPSKGLQLEARVLAVTLVRLLPTGQPPQALFDDSVFQLTGPGKAAFNAALKRWPDLWDRLHRLSVAALGRQRAQNVIESSP